MVRVLDEKLFYAAECRIVCRTKAVPLTDTEMERFHYMCYRRNCKKNIKTLY